MSGRVPCSGKKKMKILVILIAKWRKREKNKIAKGGVWSAALLVLVEEGGWNVAPQETKSTRTQSVRKLV